MREQSQVGRSAESDVEEAKQTISDLFGRIVEIKEKAAHSEELVQVICKLVCFMIIILRNISKLDTAKRNLTESLNALARLQMFDFFFFLIFRFTTSLDEAESIQGTHQYIKASRSLGAVLQLSEFFNEYKDIESVSVFSP